MYASQSERIKILQIYVKSKRIGVRVAGISLSDPKITSTKITVLFAKRSQILDLSLHMKLLIITNILKLLKQNYSMFKHSLKLTLLMQTGFPYQAKYILKI